MVKKNTTKVPDAWEDDDWETQADKAATDEPEPVEPPAHLSKKERLAQHAEFNRKLWESAQDENGGAPLQYLAAAPSPPLTQPFKGPMKVLSRKPAPQHIAKRDPVTGLANLNLEDESDEEADKPRETPEEIRARQQRELEEKQRRYEEARAKIFGDTGGSKSGSGRSSGASTPGATTPPRPSDGRRGRGGRRGGHRGGGERGGDRRNNDHQRPGSNAAVREHHNGLYDPNYSPKPGFNLERREQLPSGGAPLSGRSTPRGEDQVIRAPRGPDASGRSGFGFARRGGKES